MVIFTFLPAWGMANAAATLVGQNLGAKRPERAVRSAWRAAYYNAGFLTAVAIVFIVMAEPIMRVFSEDPAVIAYGVECLRWFSYGYPIFGIGMVIVQAINGAGDTDTPTKINFVCYWMIQIPLAYLLAHNVGWGASGVFAAVAIAQAVLALIGVWIFRLGYWKTKAV